MQVTFYGKSRLSPIFRSIETGWKRSQAKELISNAQFTSSPSQRFSSSFLATPSLHADIFGVDFILNLIDINLNI
jgi:hypothetical protein